MAYANEQTAYVGRMDPKMARARHNAPSESTANGLPLAHLQIVPDSTITSTTLITTKYPELGVFRPMVTFAMHRASSMLLIALLRRAWLCNSWSIGETIRVMAAATEASDKMIIRSCNLV